MIVGKIRVENYRGMSFGIYDENNRLHATAVTERADLQAICDGYNSFVALSVLDDPGEGVTISIDTGIIGEDSSVTYTSDNPDQPRRGRGRPRKEQAATE